VLEACAHPMSAHASQVAHGAEADCHGDDGLGAGHTEHHGHGDHDGHGAAQAPHSDDHGHDDHGCTCGFHCVGATGAVRDAAPATLSLPAPPPPPVTPLPASAEEDVPGACAIPHFLPFAQAPPLHA
jgi:hypothetical protein